MNDILIAIVLGVVEGLTEFIPVSSTGHLIVVGELLGFEGDRAATFEVVIQLGAILAVVVLYRERLRSMLTLRSGPGLQGINGLRLLLLTSLPAVVLGAAAHSVITGRLFSTITVAVGWALGGIGLLVVERMRPAVTCSSLDRVTTREAVIIGLAQCLALWPGFSRAAATISGGMMLGLHRTTAAEYSFLAAIPVISGASLLELARSRETLVASDLPMFVVGFAVAFVTALVTVNYFIARLSTLTLRAFGYYRLGAAILALLFLSRGWL